MSITWRLLKTDPSDQPGTDREVIFRLPSYLFKYRFVRVRISILTSKIILTDWKDSFQVAIYYF